MWDDAGKQSDSARVPAALERLWNADPGSVSLVSQGVNAVFRFETAGAGQFARIVHGANVSRIEIESALDYLHHLVAAGVPVCRPVASDDGAWIETPAELDGSYFATVVEEVPGELIGFEHTDDAVYEAWGRSLAELHVAAETYLPMNDARFESVDSVWRDIERRIKPGDAVVRDEFERVGEWLEALPRGPEVFGLTHFDYRPGNIFWDGSRAWAIDFDDPVYHWYASDFARPFLEFSEQEVPGRHAFLDAFARGYRSVRPLDERWVGDVTWFHRLMHLGRYTWTEACWTGDTVPGGEDRDSFFARTRERLANPRPW